MTAAYGPDGSAAHDRVPCPRWIGPMSCSRLEPGYAGRMYFLAQSGNIIELTVRPRRPGQE